MKKLSWNWDVLKYHEKIDVFELKRKFDVLEKEITNEALKYYEERGVDCESIGGKIARTELEKIKEIK